MFEIWVVPGNTRHWTSGCLMLDQRRRRWDNIKPHLGQCVVSAGVCLISEYVCQKWQVQKRAQLWSFSQCCRPASTVWSTNVYVMLVHLLRLWHNIAPTLIQRFKFAAGTSYIMYIRINGSILFFSRRHFFKAIIFSAILKEIMGMLSAAPGSRTSTRLTN